MRYLDRMLIGLGLIILAFGALYLGSPLRTGQADANPGFAYGFCLLFALGFIIGAMGLLGSKDDYPGLLSGLVLYFMVGALITVFLYVKKEGHWTLAEADDPQFWIFWLRRMALWLSLIHISGDGIQQGVTDHREHEGDDSGPRRQAGQLLSLIHI